MHVHVHRILIQCCTHAMSPLDVRWGAGCGGGARLVVVRMMSALATMIATRMDIMVRRARVVHEGYHDGDGGNDSKVSMLC